jgi:hypothetical protein
MRAESRRLRGPRTAEAAADTPNYTLIRSRGVKRAQIRALGLFVTKDRLRRFRGGFFAKRLIRPDRMVKVTAQQVDLVVSTYPEKLPVAICSFTAVRTSTPSNCAAACCATIGRSME